MREKREPDRICRAGGREFHLYKYFDEYFEEEMINYPNFDESPEYTVDGRPFVLGVQECCAHGKSGDPDNPNPWDCAGCIWLCLDNPDEPIGVCMCDERRHEPTTLSH